MSNLPDKDIHDNVIVGAGSAGCVLAARPSEEFDASEPVLEAGPPDDVPEIAVPVAGPWLWNGPLAWPGWTAPQSGGPGSESSSPSRKPHRAVRRGRTEPDRLARESKRRFGDPTQPAVGRPRGRRIYWLAGTVRLGQHEPGRGLREGCDVTQGKEAVAGAGKLHDCDRRRSPVAAPVKDQLVLPGGGQRKSPAHTDSTKRHSVQRHVTDTETARCQRGVGPEGVYSAELCPGGRCRWAQKPSTTLWS